MGNEAKWDLGGVRDQVACFAQDGEGVEGSKAFLVDREVLQAKLGQGLGFGKEVERQSGGGKNMGSSLEGYEAQRML